MGKERILTSINKNRASLMEGDGGNQGDLVTLARSVLPEWRWCGSAQNIKVYYSEHRAVPTVAMRQGWRRSNTPRGQLETITVCILDKKKRDNIMMP